MLIVKLSKKRGRERDGALSDLWKRYEEPCKRREHAGEWHGTGEESAKGWQKNTRIGSRRVAQGHWANWHGISGEMAGEQ